MWVEYVSIVIHYFALTLAVPLPIVTPKPNLFDLFAPVCQEWVGEFCR